MQKKDISVVSEMEGGWMLARWREDGRRGMHGREREKACLGKGTVAHTVRVRVRFVDLNLQLTHFCMGRQCLLVLRG